MLLLSGYSFVAARAHSVTNAFSCIRFSKTSSGTVGGSHSSVSGRSRRSSTRSETTSPRGKREMVSCPPSRLSLVPISREGTLQGIAPGRQYRELKFYKRNGPERTQTAVPDHIYSKIDSTPDPNRVVRTAPAASSTRKSTVSYGFNHSHRQISQPKIIPFSEKSKPPPRISPVCPTPAACSRVGKRRRFPGPVGAGGPSPGDEHFRDRSYMSEIYPWARASQEAAPDTIKGQDLTETILTYKPYRSPSPGGLLRIHNEDSLRSGLGYEGYMDCLLRGRRQHVRRKSAGITSELGGIKDEEPTLVPMNSLVRD